MRLIMAINIVATFVFIGLIVATPLTEVGLAARYTELDRADVINNEALAAFDKERDTDLASNARYLVPRWIASDALSQSRLNAVAGVTLALLNLAVIGYLALRGRSKQGSNTHR